MRGDSAMVHLYGIILQSISAVKTTYFINKFNSLLEICAERNTRMSVENELYYIKVNILGDHNIFENIDYVE